MKRLLLLVGCLLVLAAVVVRYLWLWWYQPFPGQQAAVIAIDSGSSLASVATELEQKGVLRHSHWWRVLVQLQGLDGKIKQGEYRILASYSPARQLAMLLAGEVMRYSVTLPEGLSLQQSVELLQQQAKLDHTLLGADDPRLLALVQPYTHTEGLFFPDTYSYTRGESDFAVLRRAYQRMQTILAQEWQHRAVGLPYASAYEALIMASIIEKETGQAAERDKIAGVFTRRLQRGMRLQTDPSVIYGLGKNYTGNLRRHHLEDATNLYNSYRHAGLPPTPIALPGRASLHASLHPGSGTELYFVATGDGSHVFSATLQQHNDAVRAYQKRRVKNYRSAPQGSNGTP